MSDLVTRQAVELPDLRHEGLRLLGFVSDYRRSWIDCYFEPDGLSVVSTLSNAWPGRIITAGRTEVLNATEARARKSKRRRRHRRRLHGRRVR